MGERSFLAESSKFEEADIVIFGVPLGKDAKKILTSLRETSWFVEFFDVDKKRNLIEKVKFYDAGDIQLTSENDIVVKTKEILESKKIPLILGKSHLLTLFVLRAFDNVKVVSFDAHADIKNEYYDEKISQSTEPLRIKEQARYNCATWLRRAFEEGKKDIAIVGLRSCDEDDFSFIEKNKILAFSPNKIKKDFYEKKRIKENLKKFVRDSKVYLSIDIDVFDPSIAPAVEHPEPNGLLLPEFLELLEIFKGKIVGFDLVEIAFCEKKLMEITEFLATRVILEVLSRIK
ncbi:MAG: arginase family protein [Candidatus Aenigmatarchaeota archaeon]